MTPARLFLVGYRGTGKTTVGRLVAAKLGWAFVDADDRLEAAAGKTVAEVFASEGEVGFRGREAVILAELAALENTVVATGGGAVLRPANRTHLATGFVVLLTASPSVIGKRTAGDPTNAARRPNLTEGGGLEEVMTVLAAREPLYRSVADLVVPTDERSPDDVAADILTALGEKG
jgi:shikimate kinase